MNIKSIFSFKNAVATVACCSVMVSASSAEAMAFRPDNNDLESKNSFEYVGKAVVTDGDTIHVASEKIRLHGIDAPESGQFCENSIGKLYRCGQESAWALDKMIDDTTVFCKHKDQDRYGRKVAECFVKDGDQYVNLNSNMVLSGQAIAYTKYSGDYVEQQSIAKNNRSGIWQGNFVDPSKWRRGERLDQEKKDYKDCPIKGNVNSKGQKIYHTQQSPWYAKVKIKPEEGDKCFSSEEQARKEGFRSAKSR